MAGDRRKVNKRDLTKQIIFRQESIKRSKGWKTNEASMAFIRGSKMMSKLWKDMFMEKP